MFSRRPLLLPPDFAHVIGLTSLLALLALPSLTACDSCKASTETFANGQTLATPRSFPAGEPAHLFDGATCPSALACNAVKNVARVVTVIELGGSLPGFKGGNIKDGVYILSGATSFNSGAGGRKLRMTLEVKGNTVDIAQDGDCENASRHATFTTHDKTIDYAFSCPIPLKDAAYYSAFDDELSYTDSSGAFGVVYTFTKQH